MPGDRRPPKRKQRPPRERIEYAPSGMDWLEEQLEPVVESPPPRPQATEPGPFPPEPPLPPEPPAPPPEPFPSPEPFPEPFPPEPPAPPEPFPPEPAPFPPQPEPPLEPEPPLQPAPPPQAVPAPPPQAEAQPWAEAEPEPQAEAEPVPMVEAVSEPPRPKEAPVPAPEPSFPPEAEWSAPAPEAEAPEATGPAASPSAAAVAAEAGGNRDLRSDDLLSRPPAGPLWGWQALVYQLSGGRVRPAPGAAERANRELEARVSAPIEGCQRIAVIALKGGVGKTTTTACLGAIFAEYRSDRVVAVDANPDPGTLGYRIRRDTMRTAKDLLANVDKLERYADVRAYASQTDLRLEVITSEADPSRTEAFDEDDYRELAGVLERFYSLILTDCGPGLLHSAMQAILPTADQLVVVAAPSLDGARSASLTLEWLQRHGHGRLAESSVVVINAIRDHGLVDVNKLEGHFARRCRAVVRVPFDRHLETGAEIVLDELAPVTRQAYVRLAAAVADGFGGPDRKHEQR
ncbi:MAG TPA: AAA family ATPase [Actinomycetota bacterium]|nr:AAA family ATPase [Actinomycetota bacterium]